MKILLQKEPNVVWEAAMILYCRANDIHFRDKKAELAKLSGTDEREMDAGFDALIRFTELIEEKIDIDRDVSDYLFSEREEIGSCLAFLLLHSEFTTTDPDFVSSLGRIKDMSKATFFANIYSLLLGRFPELESKTNITNYADFINFIAVLPVSPDLKWELTSFYNNFDQLKGLLALMIGKVGKLFLDGYDLVRHCTEWFLASYKMSSSADEEGYLRQTYKALAGKSPDILYVIPTVCSADRVEYLMNFTEEQVTDFLYVGVLHASVKELKETPFDDAKLCRTLKVMGDRSKFEILRLVGTGPKYGQQLAEALGISTATISHHVSQLEETELIHVERDANRIYYSLNRETVEGITKNLTALFLKD